MPDPVILPANINPRIVEALYAEALVLADAVRARFDGSTMASVDAAMDEETRIAMSCEGLRTTTRVMHCMAWLLNHRAYFRGEISELQLRHHGRLIANYPAGESHARHLLPDDALALVANSERLYARIGRLEQAWRAEASDMPRFSAIDRLRQRLGATG